MSQKYIATLALGRGFFGRGNFFEDEGFEDEGFEDEGFDFSVFFFPTFLGFGRETFLLRVESDSGWSTSSSSELSWPRLRVPRLTIATKTSTYSPQMWTANEALTRRRVHSRVCFRHTKQVIWLRAHVAVEDIAEREIWIFVYKVVFLYKIPCYYLILHRKSPIRT